MAYRDYIHCAKCDCKLIYDGYDTVRERLEELWGDPKASEYTVPLLCPDCQPNYEPRYETALREARNILRDQFSDSTQIMTAMEDALAVIDEALGEG